jgi:hypothetical protein
MLDLWGKSSRLALMGSYCHGFVVTVMAAKSL